MPPGLLTPPHKQRRQAPRSTNQRRRAPSHLHADRGGGQRQAAAQDDGAGAAQGAAGEGQPGVGDGGEGDDDLGGAHAKHKFAHRGQAVKGQLQADVEEQEDDAQLGQVPDALHVLDDAQRVWPDERAAGLSGAEWASVGGSS